MKTFIATYLLDKQGELNKSDKPMVEKIQDKIEHVFDKAIDYESAHYTGPLSQSQLASSKLQIHAFENDIKMTGSSYTIYVNQDDDDAVVDVFMETK